MPIFSHLTVCTALPPLSIGFFNLTSLGENPSQMVSVVFPGPDNFIFDNFDKTLSHVMYLHKIPFKDIMYVYIDTYFHI